MSGAATRIRRRRAGDVPGFVPETPDAGRPRPRLPETPGAIAAGQAACGGTGATGCDVCGPAHNPEVVGSNPTPATTVDHGSGSASATTPSWAVREPRSSSGRDSSSQAILPQRGPARRSEAPATSARCGAVRRSAPGEDLSGDRSAVEGTRGLGPAALGGRLADGGELVDDDIEIEEGTGWRAGSLTSVGRMDARKTGLREREAWEQTWALQRRGDPDLPTWRSPAATRAWRRS